MLISIAATFPLLAQTLNSGSNGSHGALEFPAAPEGRSDTRNLEVPPDGVFHFTTISIGSRVGVTFTPNALNTPIYFLATGDVIINGNLDVAGKPGSASAGGLGGPGGFNGGNPGSPSLPPGDGFGPGAGKGGDNCNLPSCAGSGSYGTVGGGNSTNSGATYGSPLVIPLVGGSGGGAIPGGGGGGGGGAILIASNTRIQINGAIFARGSGREGVGFGETINGGSGGAIRLVAPVVGGSLSFLLVDGGGGSAGRGRIRIDAFDRTGFSTSGPAVPTLAFGKVMSVFPPLQSRLSILSAAGQNIPEGTNAPVSVLLPFGSDTNQVVRVQARDFAGLVPINVVVTPQNGSRQIFPAEINMATGNPAIANIPVIIPLNTEAAIHAWTR